MGDKLGGGESHGFLAVSNGFKFELNDLVDVFVGTAPNIRGKKTISVRDRFKGDVFGTTVCGLSTRALSGLSPGVVYEIESPWF
jgi:hypothetical protein